LLDDWTGPKFPLPSTYDEVLYDPKTGTYYGILYPREEHEANLGKPTVVHILEDECPDSGSKPADGSRVDTAEKPS
jgi:hypothetical protein